MGEGPVGDRPLRVIVDLDLGAEPISGTIAAEPGSSERFTGVMQLVAALDRLRDAAPSEAGSPGHKERVAP